MSGSFAAPSVGGSANWAIPGAIGSTTPSTIVSTDLTSLNRNINTPRATQTLVASTSIACNGTVLPLTCASNITLSSNPQIATGVDGQIVTLANIGPNAITLVTGNGLLMPQNFPLYGGRIVNFRYLAAFSSWILDDLVPESVALTGASTTPTPAWNTNSTQIASTGFVYNHLYDHNLPGWRALTLNTGWAIFGGATYGGLGIKRIGRDIICLRGIVQVSGTFNSTIIVAGGLPADCRPSTQISLIGMSGVTNGTQFDITASGSIVIFNTLTAGQYVSLNATWVI